MPALNIHNLNKTYDQGTIALDNINLKVQAGDFFALLGPNGAGKTSLINIITSLIDETSGDVEIFGHNIKKQRTLAKSLIGVVPQEFNFSIFETTLQIVVNSAGYYGIPRKTALQRAEKYLTQLQLWDKRNTYTRFLSGGMKRRLMIARAMVHDPKMLILDEPSAGVDVQVRRIMWDFLTEMNQQQGTTIILTTHYLEEAENLCKNLAIIDHGKLIKQGSMNEVLSKLQLETVILYLEQELKHAPQLNNTEIRLIDPNTLEIDLFEDTTISDLLAQLQQQRINVKRIKNKTNRLEKLFINLIENSSKE